MKLQLFQTDYSLGDSILTLVAPKDKIDVIKSKPLAANKSISVFEIAIRHNLPELFVVDEALTGFFEAFKVSKELKIPCHFGWKVSVVSDAAAKNEESLSTESKVIIWIANEQAYYDLVRYYTKASTENFYYYKRLDWKDIQDMWNDNFELSIPFYSSFIARNSLYYGHAALPIFGDIVPFIHLEEHELPFDGLIRRKMQKWNGEFSFPEMETFTSTHYRLADNMAALTNRLIKNGGTWERPEQSHYSGRFDYEYIATTPVNEEN